MEARRWQAYTIRLMAGSRSVEAKALAESKAVTIALADRALDERLRTADVLEVRGEGATSSPPCRADLPDANRPCFSPPSAIVYIECHSIFNLVYDAKYRTALAIDTGRAIGSHQ